MQKLFEWDKEKNQKLLRERGVSFEAVVSHIENGNIVAVVQGKGQYKHQRQFILMINQYAYIVPFVEDSKRIFLKTIIPSRKMTRHYLSGGDLNENI